MPGCSGAEGSGQALLQVPDGPPELPFIGNVLRLNAGIHVASQQLISEYGSIFTVRFPSGMVTSGTGALGSGQRTVILADPELIGDMFSKEEDFGKLTFKHCPEIRGPFGASLFTTDDDEPIYHQAARVIRPAFAERCLRDGFFDKIVQCSEQLRSELLRTGGALPLDFHALMSQYALEVLGHAAFGLELGCFDGGIGQDFLEALHGIAEISVRQAGQSSFNSVQRALARITGDSRAIPVLKARMDRVVAEIVRRKTGQMASREAGAGDAGLGSCPFSKKAGSMAACPMKDVMERMMTEADPKTGEQLPEDNVEAQLLTLLVAGHESTSTAMTMLFYHVAMNPHVEQRLLQEIRSVVGDGPLKYEHLAQLKYVYQVVKENLRINTPSSRFMKTSPPDRSVSLGPYVIPPGTDIVVPTWGLHHNAKVWPEPEKFDPDRFSEENSASRSPYSFLPFSYGKRGCMGAQFSLLQQRVTLIETIRNFHLRVDPSTHVTWCEPLKGEMIPHGIKLQVTGRLGHDGQGASAGVSAGASGAKEGTLSGNSAGASDAGKLLMPTWDSACEGLLRGRDLLILHGSNMGTCEDFADRLLATCEGLGMRCRRAALDDVVGADFSRVGARVELPKEGMVAVISSTYNGKAPDNAVRFEQWLQTADAAAAIPGLHVACFGCGNKQWAGTYMALLFVLWFPRRIESNLLKLGAKMLTEMGEGDADSGQAESAFVSWKLALAASICKAQGIRIPLAIRESLNPSAPSFEVVLHLGKEARDIEGVDATQILEDALARAKGSFLKNCRAWVTQVSLNRELLTDEAVAQGRSTRHIEVDLPEGHGYRAGDHLGVWGANPDEVVAAHMDYFRLPHDSVVSLSLLRQSDASCLVPLQRKTDVWSTLAYCFDLQQPASMAQIEVLAPLAVCPAERADLEQLSSDAGCHAAKVLAGKRTLLEILTAYGSVKLPFGKFLGMLPAMKPRFYSISSSPIKCPNSLSITVSVVTGTTPSGRKHIGVCSNHLKEQPRLRPASVGLPADAEHYMPLILFVKDSGELFRLPEPNVPVILVGPGTGVAPMRGFLQERAAQGARENILFFGCRDRHEFLYQSELEELQASGYLKLFVALSREPSVPKTYVQNLIEQESDLVVDFLQRGARIYVCGDASRMAPEVRATFQRVAEKIGLGDSFVASMVKQGRYCEDVWA